MNQCIKCPSCGQSVNKRKISLIKDMVTSLRKVYIWCAEHRRHEFRRREIKHLLLTENESAHFGDWVYFGGILYKPDKGRGYWGMNMERAKAFLDGKSAINTVCIKDPLTQTHELSEEKFISQIRGIETFLDENKDYVPEYL